jgi:GTPase SAR1 family protein
MYSNDNINKLTKKLKKIPFSRIIFVAWFSAVTALPFLSKSGKKKFSYWGDDVKQKYLYSLLNVIDICYCAFILYNNEQTSADITYRFDREADTYCADISVYVTDIQAAADVVSETCVNDVINTILAAAKVTERATDIIPIATAKSVGTGNISAFLVADKRDLYDYVVAAAVHAANYVISIDTTYYYFSEKLYDDEYNFDPALAYQEATLKKAEVDRDKKFTEKFLSNINEIILGNIHKIIIDTSLYGPVWSTFISDLNAVAGNYWANHYRKLFYNGLQMDVKELERRLQVPKEYQLAGAKTVCIYLEEVDIKGLAQLSELRLILLGEKGAGKTSFVRRILNEELRMDEESTIGIDYRKWEIKGSNLQTQVRVHLWDFAGHVITHAAYPMFLTSGCIYVLIYDGRTEERNRIKYWLNTIRKYAHRPPQKLPVFLFVNLRDLYKPKISEKMFRETFKELDLKEITYCNLLNNKSLFKQFKNKLAEWIRNNPSLCTNIVATLLPVKDYIEAEFKAGNHVINKENLLSKIQDITEENLNRALSLLLPIGTVLWKEDIPSLENYIFDPSWVSHGVYSILNWLGKVEKHELFATDLDMIFRKHKQLYPQRHYELLKRIMIEYDLAYSEKRNGIEEENYLVVPTTMPADQPIDNIKDGFPDDQCLVSRFRFVAELPSDTISRFIVMHHKDIDISGGITLVWRYGVQLRRNDQIALVLENDNMITLHVLQRGMKNSEASHLFFKELQETLMSIFNKYKQAMPTFEYLIQTDKESVFFSREQLEYIQRMGGLIMNINFNGGLQQGFNMAGLNTGTQKIEQTICNFNPQEWNYEMQEQLDMLEKDLQRNGYSVEAEELRACLQDLKEAEIWDKPQDFHRKGLKARFKRLLENLADKTSGLSKALVAIGFANGIWKLGENINQLFQWLQNSPLR